MKTKIVICLIVLISITSGFAFNEGDRKLEGWYHMFTLGTAPNSTLNEFKYSDIQDVAIEMDFLRFYFPVSSNLMIGAGINGNGIRLKDSDMQDNYYIYSLSAQYYMDQIGDGLFIRADYGATRAVVTGGSTTMSTDWSTGFLVGIGYALPISQETSILLNVNYKELDIKVNGISSTFKTLGFSVGWLW